MEDWKMTDEVAGVDNCRIWTLTYTRSLAAIRYARCQAVAGALQRRKFWRQT